MKTQAPGEGRVSLLNRANGLQNSTVQRGAFAIELLRQGMETTMLWDSFLKKKKKKFFPLLTNNTEAQPTSRQSEEVPPVLPLTPLHSTYFLLAQERDSGLHPELAQVPQLFYRWVCHESI